MRSTSGHRCNCGTLCASLRNPDGTPARRGIHVLLESGEGGVVDDCRTVEKGKCTFTPTTGVYIVRLNEAGHRGAIVGEVDRTLAGKEKEIMTV